MTVLSVSERRALLAQREWRIVVKSDDGAMIRHQEPFTGSAPEAKRRAWLMWARTSFIVGKPAHGLNRDVYTSLEVWDAERQTYRLVKEKRGRLDRKAPAPAGS